MLTGRLGFLCRADCKAVVFVTQTPVPHSEQRRVPHRCAPLLLRQASRCLVRALAAAPTVPQQCPGSGCRCLSAEKDFGWILSQRTGHWNWRGACPPLPTAVREMLSGHHPSIPGSSWPAGSRCFEMIGSPDTLSVPFPGCSPWIPPGQFLCSARSPRKAQSGSVRSLETQAWQARGSGEVQLSALSLESEVSGDESRWEVGAGLWPTYWTSLSQG